jgi:hypothetical protein
LFFDKYNVGFEGGANFGFRNWHPVPLVANFASRIFVHQLCDRATTGLEEYAGKGSNGGVWEWTSTVFDTHEGLSPTNLFTGFVLHDLSLSLPADVYDFPGTRLTSSIQSTK